MADIEQAGGTISGLKSAFICEGLRIEAFVCDADGRHPETEKVHKVLDWPPCHSVTEAKVFIELCVYYSSISKVFERRKSLGAKAISMLGPLSPPQALLIPADVLATVSTTINPPINR